MFKNQFLYSPFFSHTRTHSHTVFRGCALSRGGCSFQSVQYAWSHYTGGDSNLITLKPTLTLYFQAVQSLTAFGGYTGIFPLEKPHSLCTSLSLRFLIHQITSTALAVCIGYCWAYPPPYQLSHTLPMADNAKQLVYAYRRVAG